MRVCSVCSNCYDDPVLCCSQEDHPSLFESRDGSTEMIAGYRLEFLLESGRHGETYRARQVESGTSCIIRILPADDLNSPRFFEEAKLAAALFHPHVADVYEAGVLENGQHFVVAEDSGCETLRERLKTADTPDLLTTLEIIRQSSEALHGLHLRGLKHRAVKPENIVLSTDQEGHLMVRVQHLDVGGITQHSIVSNKFLIESALGSLKYFAPEQIHDVATPQTDIYSLGIVFYEMLAGKPPFSAAKAAALIEKHRNQPPPDIRIDDFNLRMLITHALMESLQKQPDLRQRSALTLARQLRHIEQLATHVSTPPPVGVIPPAPSRSAPRLSVAIDPASAAAIAPSVMTRTPDSIKVKEARPRAISAEREPMGLFDAQVEPIQDGILQRSEDLTGIPELVLQDPVIESLARVAPKPRPSRLKLVRKRWHSNLAVAQPAEVKSLSPTESAEVNFAPLAERTAEITPVHMSIAPTRIEWVQPDDDIPSVADVLAVLSKEEGTDTSLFQAEPREITPLPVPQAAAGAELARVETDIPFVKQIVDNRSQELAVEGVDLEEEEITVVRPLSKQIVIEWERPVSEPADFYPAFAPELRPNGAIHSRGRDPIFAAYSSPPGHSARRPVLIGAGILALVVLFLFGKDSLTSIQTESPVEPVAQSRSPLPVPLVDKGQPSTVRTSKKEAIETDRKLGKEQPDKKATETDRILAKEQPDKKAIETDRKLPREQPDKKANQSRIAQARRTAPLPDPYVRQKTVISSENGKVTSRVEPERERSAAPSKATPPSRPRVVRNSPD